MYGRLALAVLALQRAAEDVLRRTLDVLVLVVHAAVAAHRALHVELLRALLIGRRAAVAPHLLALVRRRRTVAVETIACGRPKGREIGSVRTLRNGGGGGGGVRSRFVPVGSLVACV